MKGTNGASFAPDQQMTTKSPKNLNGWWTFEKIILLIIILFATFFRLFMLGDKSLWGDEINIANRALGISSMGSGNAWLYPAILKLVVIGLGPGDFSFRLPAAMISIATIPLIYSTGKLFFNGQVGLVSALLLTISLIHINYAQEVHSYALFAFLSLLSFYILWRALAFNRKKYWLIFGLVMGLTINIHFYGIFVLGSASMLIVLLTLYQAEGRSLEYLWVGIKQRWVNVLAAFGLIFLITLPSLVLYVVPQLLQLVGITPKTGRLLDKAGVRRFDISPELIEKLLTEVPLWRYPGRSLLDEFFWAVLLAGLIYLLVKQPAKFLAVVIWITVPLLPVALFALSAGIDFSTRRLIFILPICLITIAVGVVTLGRILEEWKGMKLSIEPIVTALVVIIFGWLSLTPLQWYYHSEKRDWKRAATLLQAVVQPDDFIIVHASEGHPNTTFLEYYYRPPGALLAMPRDDLTVEIFEEQFEQHKQLWYVRKIIQQDNLLEIETWLRQNDFLTFAFGGSGVGLDYEGLYISYHNKNVHSEEQKLAAWQEILEKAFALKPGRWYMYEALSDLYLRQREYEQAIALWKQFLADNPDDVTPLVGLAKIYEAGGQPEQAFIQIKEAIKIDPGDLRIYNTLGYMLRSRGGSEQALADIYQQLEAVDPAVAHFALALYYADASQHESAIREFQAVLELDPSQAVAAEARRWLNLYE